MANEIVPHSEEGDTYAEDVVKRGEKSLDRTANEKVKRILQAYVDSVGSQVAAAASLGISQAFLSALLASGRGGGPKLIRGLNKIGRTDIIQELFGAASEAPSKPSEQPRYPNRSAAIELLVENGDATLEEAIAAADAVGTDLFSKTDLPRLEWVEDIRTELRRRRRGEPHPGIQVTVEEAAKEQAATVKRFQEAVKNGGKKK